MANFRNGNLVQGQTLGSSSTTVMLSSNNQTVSPGSNQVIFLQSDASDASTRRFNIQSSTITGQDVTFIFESADPLACELLYTPGVGNVRITSLWAPTQYDCITLAWDGQLWVEVSRSNTIGGNSGFNPEITDPSDGQVLIYDGSDQNWKNQTISRDATISGSGALTISDDAITSSKLAAGSIVNSNISSSAAIQYSKLDICAPAQIICGNEGYHSQAIYMSGDVTIDVGVTTISTGSVTIGKCDQSVIATNTVTLTNAQILSLGTTPFVLVGAISGYLIFIDSVEIKLINAGSTAYATIGGLLCSYISGSNIMSFSTSIITVSTDTYSIGIPSTSYGVDTTGAMSGLSFSNNVSKGIQLSSVGAVSLGNAANSLVVRCTYRAIQSL